MEYAFGTYSFLVIGELTADLLFHIVSKVTLDIICETAFGYKTDSLHNPHNELAEAYESLLNLQTGTSCPGCFKVDRKDVDGFHQVLISRGSLRSFQSPGCRASWAPSGRMTTVTGSERLSSLV